MSGQENLEETRNIESEAREPTIEELIETVRGTLTDGDCDDLATMDFDCAWDNATTMLEELGIDSTNFFLEKGLFQ